MTAADHADTTPALGRAELVAESVARWQEELAALGGRDPLLAFRDLKIGTLDLAAAESEARKRLLDGEPVLVSKLFPHEPLRSSALRSTRAIRDKARELAQERGLSACLLAVGVATWAYPFAAHRPTAPVLMRTASVVARDPAETDFVIEVADDPFVNPVLLHALDTQLGLRFAADDLRDPAGRLRYTSVVERLREFAPPHVVDGFSIAHRAVLATFATEPLVLANDLAAFGAELVDHDVVAALAGDGEALTAISRDPGAVPPSFPVFDLDADQEAVIAAAAAGEGTFRIDAPPGSGRTQAVAGIVAELVGRGQRVLVVGQKRATLDDLIDRIDRIGLRDVVLDLGKTPPSAAVDQVTQAVRRLAAAEPEPSGPDDHDDSAREAGELAARLDAHRQALHRPREASAESAYEALVAVATTPAASRTTARVPADALVHGDLAAVVAQLREYAELEGLTLTEDASPWWGADVATTEAAATLLATVVDLRERAIPRLRDAATRAAVEVGLAGPGTIAECLDTVSLLTAVAATIETFGPQVWSEPLDDLAAASGDRAYRAEHSVDIGYLARRRLRRRVRELTGGIHHDRAAEFRVLVAAREQLTTWRQRARDGRTPRTGEHLPQAVQAAEAVTAALGALSAAHPRAADLRGLPYAEAARRLADLVADEHHLRAMPRLAELAARLSDAGVDEILRDLRGQSVSAGRAEAVVGYAWRTSLLDHWRATDEALRSFDADRFEQLRARFRAADVAALAAAARKVQVAHAAHVATVAADVEGQTAVVVESATRAAPHSPRQLVEVAPDIALAAVPCWVMSPLTVATALPPQRLFDVVVVEDAGRVAVAQSVPALARARRAILVGDEEVALTSFTTVAEPPPDPDEHEGPWGEAPLPSAVDALRSALPVRPLRQQYRARDDRLVGFAARTTYAGRMLALPGVGGANRLTIDLVEAPSGEDDPVDSSSTEVARVVDLILEHLRVRPHESLGVVTLGPRHAARLDAALRRALVRHPQVAGYVHEDRAEPFFVKDVELVSGDVRDAIILSLGYGRSVDGRILYRFGALGRPGGERRLTAATTRARERMTVVSTFSAADLSPRRLTTPGAQALGEFLAYVEQPAIDSPEASTGSEVAPAEVAGPESDALAVAVADRLRRAGASVVVGLGGENGVAVAVRHPTRRDRFVLAIETDGPAWAARTPVRVRERLRPTQLARLGWSVHHVWAAAWASDPEGESQRVLAAYERAVADADAYDWAVAAAEADLVVGMPEDAGEAESPVEPGAAGAGGQGADPGDADRTGEPGPDDPTGAAARLFARPPVPAGRAISEYTGREIAAIARWVESDEVSRPPVATAELVAEELGVDLADARTRDIVLHAVRVAGAGGPGL